MTSLPKYLLVFSLILVLFVGCDDGNGGASDGDATDGDVDADLTDGDATDGDVDTDLTDGDATDGDVDTDPTDGDATDGDVDADLTDGDATDGDVDTDLTDGDADEDSSDGDIDGDPDNEEEDIECDGCMIDNVCIPAGQDHPELPCGTCNPEANSVGWSARSQGFECREAVGDCDVAEVCDGVNLACPVDAFVPVDTTCGEGPTDCSGQDTCDGAGSCQPNHFDTATTCGDDGSECVNQDTCDGSGGCTDNGFVADGADCGEGPTDCSGQDTCDGAGSCQPNHFDTATTCGDDGSECVNQDTCDGSGGCTDNGFVADGADCGEGDQCVSGMCEDCYDASGCEDLDWGARDGECTEVICAEGNSCAFNDAASGTVCQVDGSGDESDQCDGAGLCSDCTDTAGCGDYGEDANPCTDLACVANSCTDANDDTNACDLGHGCTDDHCVSGSCEVETVTAGCLIEGACVDEGTSQDADGCVACDPDVDDRSWTNMDGTACAVTDDGKPCTDDVCDGGVCVAKNDDTNTCADDIGCTETACSEGECVVSGTNAGCYIADTCYTEGTLQTATGDGSCSICEALTAWNAWTTMESGSCDDGNACTYMDTCGTGGVCEATAYSCNDHGDCNGDGSCTCADGYAGDYCDQCADGYFNYPDCQLLTEPSAGYVSITAGTFWMGSPDGNCPDGYPGECINEKGRLWKEVLHEVTLTYDIEMSKYETTENNFEDLMGWNPADMYDSDCEYGCGEDHPVKNVSWYDALAYANQLSVDRGLTPCYVLSNVSCQRGGSVGSDYLNCFDNDATKGGIEGASVTLADGATIPQQCEGYRLPTEAEWEYAIRAGTTTAFYSGKITSTDSDPNMDLIGWYRYNNGAEGESDYGTKPVGGKMPNDWGLYDMSGNIWEWVWDWAQDAYQNDTSTDPSGPGSKTRRVSRGGDWGYSAHYSRSAYRASFQPDDYSQYMGFRLCRTTQRNHCYNGELDTDLGETDLDCGGDSCTPCGTDAACVEMSDCESMNCVDNVCAAASCDDGIVNGDETDLDCGGDTCDPCTTDQACVEMSDCESQNCVDSVCVAASCDDGIENGDEEGVDCGATCQTPCFVPITAGTFWMGSPDGTCPDGYPGDCTEELGRGTNETLHQVTLTYDFEMSRYETTEVEFESLLGWNPMEIHDPDCEYGCGDDHPIAFINWFDAVAYANQLSVDQGLTPCYVLSDVSCVNGGSVGTDYMNCMDGDETYGGIETAYVTLLDGVTIPQECEGYRLPTEAEWEYSIRAGTTTAFYNGEITDDWVDPNLDLIAWYFGTTGTSTDPEYGSHPVGTKNPNAWGLYDMSGNVFEWVWDWSQTKYQNDVGTDPVGPESGPNHPIRGGYWNLHSRYNRSAYRSLYMDTDYRTYSTGFRLCRTTERNHCYNGEQDADLGESDLDCGGDSCAPCGTDAACVEMSDCESLNCVDGICVAATCYDGVQNSDEEDVDCGGSCLAPCFAPITAGSFWMGSPDGSCPDDYTGDCTSELGRRSDETLHEVTLTYDFEMSRYEITEFEFAGLTGWNAMDTYDSDCSYNCGDDHPMKYTSWYDALAYANQLSMDQGLTPCYVISDVSCKNGGSVGSDYMNCFDADTTYGGIDSATVTLAEGATMPQQCEGYRLPTEAEWEYAIRAETTTAFYNGDITDTSVDPNLDLIGWYSGNNDVPDTAGYGTKSVGGKNPNSWGLYDMSGNLQEWIWNWYQSDYENDVATDPVGPESSSWRMTRGGYWSVAASGCRSAYRVGYGPDFRSHLVGFRLCRTTERNHCYNGLLDADQGETDVDCGGDSCAPCAADTARATPSD